MDLHERLTTARRRGTDWRSATRSPRSRTAIHLAVIGELGPQLFNTDIDPTRAARAGHRRHPARTSTQRAGHARATTASGSTDEIADDILGHGPLERLLADDTVTEIMVNGPYDVWVERQGRLYETTVRFTDDSHLRRIINKIVAQVGRRIDESSPMVDARLPDGSRVNAVIPPLSLSGPLRHDPQVQQEAARPARHDPARHAHRRDGRLPRSAASRPS